MKIFSISIINAPPSGPSQVLSNATDLSSFSFYQRGSVGEFMSFFSRTVAERTPQGQRQSVQENTYTAHVYNRGGAEQLAGTHPPTSDYRSQAKCFTAIIITDGEYPVRPAFSLLTKVRPWNYPSSKLLTRLVATRRIRSQSDASAIRRPLVHLVPRDQHLYPEIPGPASGGYDHEGAGGA